MKNIWTRWAVLLISMIFLSSCGGSSSSTPATPQTPEGNVLLPFVLTDYINAGSPSNMLHSGPHPGTVGNTTSGSKSYYQLTGLAEGTYTVTLYGLSADADLWVYNDLPFDYITGPVCKSQNGGTATEQCVVTVADGATMNIEVDGSFALSGATYFISVNKPTVVVAACTGLGCFNFDADFFNNETFWYATTGFVPSETGLLWSTDCITAIGGSGCSIHSTGLLTSQSSCVSYTTTTSTDSYVSFDLKVTSRRYYDLLLFYIDNVLQLPVWSGSVTQKVMFNTTTGTHTYKWCHTNNDTVTSGPVWVDNISIQ